MACARIPLRWQWIDREWPFAQNLLIADKVQGDW